MRIAIIDSGIDFKHERLKNCKVSGVLLRFLDTSKLVTSSDFIDYTGHGTACAYIIHKYVSDAELVAVKIFHNNTSPNEELLCEAINWCIKNDINIINLSIGVQAEIPMHKLSKICEEAYKQDIFMIAAANNDIHLKCYPAYFPWVFGVTAGNIKNSMDFGYIPKFPIEFIAKGGMQRVAWRNNTYRIKSGTSFACACFTGIVASFIKQQNEKSVENLRYFLINKAKKNINLLNLLNKPTHYPIPIVNNYDIDKISNQLFCISYRLNWLRNIAIFPVSEKEMGLLLKIPCLIREDVKINTLIDYPKIVKKNVNYENIIYRIPNDDEFQTFSSIVIGYFYESLFEANVNFGNELLEEAIKRDINIFVFDKYLRDYIKNKISNTKYTGKIYSPIVDANTYKNMMLFSYLDELKVPILSVIGTSSRQGKFTTQLRIKEVLKKEGYKVSHISTEPHGELFGAEFCFPYGHNGSVFLEKSKWNQFLRILERGIQKFNDPDIILTGIQGGLAPRSHSTKYIGTELNSIEFLYGVLPDGIICVINPQDSVELIKKNVEISKIYCNTKVIFYVMTPWLKKFKYGNSSNIIFDNKLINKEEYQNRIDYFQNELDARVIDIMDKNNDDLILKSVQEAFS